MEGDGEENMFSCPKEGCGKICKTKSLMNKHMKDCGIVHKCTNEDCARVYKHRGDLAKHMKTCGQTLPCPKEGCPLIFRTEKSMKQHFKVCGNQKCACGMMFKYEHSLLRHQTSCREHVFVPQEEKDLFFGWLANPADFQKVKDYLVANPSRVGLTNADRNGTAHTAALGGSAETIEYLTTLPNLLINASNGEGMSALYVAAMEGHAPCVRALLKHPDVSCNSKTKYHTVLSIACKKGHVACVQALLQDPRVDVNLAANQATPLSVACTENHLAIIDLLLQHSKIDVNKAEVKGGTALYQSCLVRKIDVVKRLLQVDALDVNKATVSGVTPLLATCSSGNFPLAKLLLQDMRVDVNLFDNRSKTALFWAAKRGYYSLFFAILNSRDKVDTETIPEGEVIPPKYTDFLLEYRQNPEIFRNKYSNMDQIHAESRKRRRRSQNTFDDPQSERYRLEGDEMNEEGDHRTGILGGEEEEDEDEDESDDGDESEEEAGGSGGNAAALTLDRRRTSGTIPPVRPFLFSRGRGGHSAAPPPLVWENVPSPLPPQREQQPAPPTHHSNPHFSLGQQLPLPLLSLHPQQQQQQQQHAILLQQPLHPSATLQMHPQLFQQLQQHPQQQEDLGTAGVATLATVEHPIPNPNPDHS